MMDVPASKPTDLGRKKMDGMAPTNASHLSEGGVRESGRDTESLPPSPLHSRLSLLFTVFLPLHDIAYFISSTLRNSCDIHLTLNIMLSLNNIFHTSRHCCSQ